MVPTWEITITKDGRELSITKLIVEREQSKSVSRQVLAKTRAFCCFQVHLLRIMYRGAVV